MLRWLKLQAHWAKAGPPLHVTLAAYVGWKPRTPAVQDVYGPEDFAAVLASMPGGERVEGGGHG
ncbi:MAG TPA: hypothetical protein VHW60_04255 [Caulobacteraceae bacterium]|nr:hypothetical protein [Caulobacteraceae bacterium]